jgi:hypothetical protein
MASMNNDVSPSVALVRSGVAEGADAERKAGRSTAKIAAGIVATFLNSNEKIPAATVTVQGKPGTVPMPRSLGDLFKTKDQALWNGFLRSSYLHFLGEAPTPHKTTERPVHISNDPVAARKAAEMRVRRGIELAVALSQHKDSTFDPKSGLWTVPAEAVCGAGEELPRSVKVVKLDGSTWFATKGKSLVKFNATIDRVMQCNKRALSSKVTAAGDVKASGKNETRDTTTEPLKVSEMVTRGKVATLATALQSMLIPAPDVKGSQAAVFWDDLSADDRNALERLMLQVATVKANGKRPAEKTEAPAQKTA